MCQQALTNALPCRHLRAHPPRPAVPHMHGRQLRQSILFAHDLMVQRRRAARWVRVKRTCRCWPTRPHAPASLVLGSTGAALHI